VRGAGRIKQQEDACRATTESLGRLQKENEEIERDVQRLPAAPEAAGRGSTDEQEGALDHLY